MKRRAPFLSAILLSAGLSCAASSAQTTAVPAGDASQIAAPSPVVATDCDRAAASEFDKQSPVVGTPFKKIDPKIAIPACIEALAKDPDSPRLNFELGRAYDADKDFSKALQFFLKSAAAHFALAQVNLGSLYFNGQGAPRDYAEAAKWDRLAADQGLAPAQANLAALYLKGLGVAQDAAEAVKLLRAAALQGFAPAQNSLAALYASGVGVAQDFAEALALYRQAADQGYAPAQANLGAIYANGQGVARNYSEAAKWYGLAADQGYESAQISLDALKTPPAGEGYSPVRIVVRQRDNNKSSRIPITVIEVSPLSTEFAMTSFSVNKGDCHVYIQDPTSLALGGGVLIDRDNITLKSELAKISLARPPFQPPLAAGPGQYMEFFTDPALCDIREVEVVVNGAQWTWPPPPSDKP